jgi:hypothetical protein
MKIFTAISPLRTAEHVDIYYEFVIYRYYEFVVNVLNGPLLRGWS